MVSRVVIRPAKLRNYSSLGFLLTHLYAELDLGMYKTDAKSSHSATMIFLHDLGDTNSYFTFCNDNNMINDIE